MIFLQLIREKKLVVLLRVKTLKHSDALGGSLSSSNMERSRSKFLCTKLLDLCMDSMALVVPLLGFSK